MACSTDSVKLKGLRTGVTGVLWRAVKRREKNRDLLARICFRRYGDSFDKIKGVKGHSVPGCVNCEIL